MVLSLRPAENRFRSCHHGASTRRRRFHRKSTTATVQPRQPSAAIFYLIRWWPQRDGLLVLEPFDGFIYVQ